MFTFNKILKRLELFQTKHKQLNSFFFGRLPEVGGSNSISYPLLYCQLSDDASQVGETIEYFNFEFLVVDIPNSKTGKDRSIQEVLSDTKQIANDLVAYLKYTDYTEGILNIDLPISMQDIIESSDDNVTGWHFTIRMKLGNELDLCSIPLRYYVNPDGYIQRSGNTISFDVNSVYNTYETPETSQLGVSLPGTSGVTAIMLHSGYIGIDVAPFATLTSGTYDSNDVNLLTFSYDGLDVTYTITQI